MKPALALLAAGTLAILLQSVVNDLFPGRVGPDLGFLLVVALGSRLPERLAASLRRKG